VRNQPKTKFSKLSLDFAPADDRHRGVLHIEYQPRRTMPKVFGNISDEIDILLFVMKKNEL
jgi:hypothetical protein